jgi:hypothetical protein
METTQMKPQNIVLGSGETVLTIGDRSITLRPTLGAALAICRAHGGISQALNKVASIDISAIGSVAAAGAGITSTAEIDDLTSELFRAGATRHAPALTAYLVALAAGDADPNADVAEVEPGNG